MTRYLYRKVVQAVTLGTALGLISCSALAQFRVAPPERKNPRAVSVLETYKNGARRLIPVSYYFDKKYFDAGLYHATPVPFTLYSETVYEVQQLGQPLGTFTVQSASQREAQGQLAWWGNGKFKGLPDPLLMAKKKAAPVVLEDPSKPVLHRREGSEGDNPAPHSTTASGGGQEAPPEDPDRPKLHRKEGSGGDSSAGQGQTQNPAQSQTAQTQTAQTNAPQTPQSTGPEESSQQDPDRPKLHRKDEASTGKSGGTSSGTSTGTATAKNGGGTGAPQSPAQPSGGGATSPAAPPAASVVTVGAVERTPSEDPDHPILRRGKPVEEQSGRDLPDFKLEEPVSRQVAVSDAGVSLEPQPLIYTCPPEERDRLEAQAREMALAELHRMGAQRGVPLAKPSETKPAAKSATGKAATGKTKTVAKKDVGPEWKPAEEQFVPFDLEYNNYAMVVYSARYMPPAAETGATKSKSWVVTVIGREDEGKLVKLYSTVSDPRELGLYPEVRLVDTVDPDGYGRFALLFREKKRDGVSWLLGRVNGYGLQTVFETAER